MKCYQEKMITDKTLIIIASIGFIISLISLLFINVNINEELHEINITKITVLKEKTYLSFNTKITGNAIYDKKINSTGNYDAVLTKIGEDFYYITGLRKHNGKIN